MNILIRGPLLSMSGYGNHARQVFQFITEEYKDANIFCDITKWGNTSWNLNESFLSDNVFSKIIKNFISERDLNLLTSKKNQYFDMSFQICLPDEWDNSIAEKNIGIFAGIESTICCEKWLDKISLMSEVIVPSRHALNSIVNAKEFFIIKDIKTPIRIIPEWFYVEINEKPNSIDNILNNVKTEKNLLLIGQMTGIDPKLDRKNIIKTLDTCINYLSDSEKSDTGIVLKIFAENNSIKDRIRVKNILSTYFNILKKQKVKLPKIYLLHGNLLPSEVMSLYKHEKITCLVSGTRGEGFGLTFLEAAACGLPIIATNWSSHTEYLEYFFKIEYNLENIPFSLNKSNTEFHEYSNIWVKNSMWAEFDSKSLKNNLHKVLNHDIEYKKIADQQKYILNKYSKNSIISIYKQYLGKKY